MDKRQVKLRVLLTGGGTGGHVYPILAIHRLLEEAVGVERALYVGAGGKAEETIVPCAGIPMETVAAAPVSGRGAASLLHAAWVNLAGVIRAAAILLRFRPHLVLASGGYVSAPVCLAAFLMRPFLRSILVVQEQNVMPGLMNKLASLFAHAVLVSFRETPYFLWSSRCVYTGYPLRREVVRETDRERARCRLEIPLDSLMILVYGGSMGARAINRAVAQLLPDLAAGGRRLDVVLSTGLGSTEYPAWRDTLDRVAAAFPSDISARDCGEGKEFVAGSGKLVCRLFPYLHEMAEFLAAADIVVCRAGAGTLSEITAAGRAAVVVPKRGLPGDHQEHNAIHLAEAGACLTVFERKGPDGFDYIEPSDLLEALQRLIAAPEERRRVAAGARARFEPEAERRILTTLRQVLERRQPEYDPVLTEPGSVRVLKQADILVNFLRSQPPGSHYRKLYSIKMEENLAAADWQSQNIGIKLVGALGRLDRLPDLIRHFRQGNGFMRRNALLALCHTGRYVPETPGLLARGLEDPYFEVRAAAFMTAGVFAGRLAGEEALVRQMKRAFLARGQHFDVRLQALKILPLFLPVEEYLDLAGPYRFVENVRLRQAVLDGLRAALDAGRIGAAQLDAARRFVGEMLITTSDFAPQFNIRDSFTQLYRELVPDTTEGEARKS